MKNFQQEFDEEYNHYHMNDCDEEIIEEELQPYEEKCPICGRMFDIMEECICGYSLGDPEEVECGALVISKSIIMIPSKNMEAQTYAEELLSKMPKGNARIYARNKLGVDSHNETFWRNVLAMLDKVIPKDKQ